MYVDRTRLDIDVVAPDGVEELIARADAARMIEEVAHQAELGRTQMHPARHAGHAVSDEIHSQHGELQPPGVGAWTGSPDDSTSTGERVGRAERASCRAMRRPTP